VILLWGLTGDDPYDAVRAALTRRGAPFTMIDQRLVRQTDIELTLADRLTGTVAVGGDQVRLEDVDAVYWRTYDVSRLPALAGDGPGSAALQTAWALEHALVAWLELTDALVVNRASAMVSNNSKPFQLDILRSHGFSVPATLVTTDPQAVLRFWTDHASVIYKSVSGKRSIVARLTESHLSRLEHVTSCPTQFQQFIPGRDHRVHVVGDDVFACEVHSDADDYRYAGVSGEPAQIRPARIPDEVAQRCVTVTHALGLQLSGVDLRRAPDGRWFCFEVNPSPAFTYYEAQTGQPIADAIASLLAAGRIRRPLPPP
jgi:glutathione synthase/RimK-type ligase-like ATP-grasp enzyme